MVKLLNQQLKGKKFNKKTSTKNSKNDENKEKQPKKRKFGGDADDGELSKKSEKIELSEKNFKKSPKEKVAKTKSYDSTKKPTKKFTESKKPAFNGKKFQNDKIKKEVTNGEEEKPQLKGKELKKQRRMKKLSDNYQMTVDIKKIWEALRKSDTTDETKSKLCRTLHEQVKGKVKVMAAAHDTVRVIECLVQYGNELQRNTIFTELNDQLVDLAKSKYGRFLVLKMLTYGTKEQKEHVINAFKGYTVKLIKHSFACKLIESIFNEHANANQRNKMLAEFYDLKSGLILDDTPKTLAEILKAQPESKEKILDNIKTHLLTCIQKSLLMFSLIHRVFLEYFTNCDQKMKSEMIDALGEHIVHMVHTKDGSEVAKQCVWFSTAKQRKLILKSLKSFIQKMACEEYGHVVLIAIFDSVDDTKIVSKIILDELFRSIDELFENEYGRKVIRYLVAPRDSRFFLKDFSKRLEVGDASETSKKDKSIRYNELLQYSLKYLCEYINKNLFKCLINGSLSVIVPIVISKLENPADMFSKLASLLLNKPFEKSESADSKKDDADDDEEKNKIMKTDIDRHLIEHTVSHLTVKHIILNDKDVESKSLTTFTETLLAHENADYIKTWCENNRGCFLLISMIETCKAKETQEKIKNLLKDVNLEKYTFAGAKVLRKKLTEIK